MKVVVTGGLGFIGHNVAQYLKNQGFNIICIDNLSNYNHVAVSKIKSEGIEIVQKDVSETQTMKELLNGCDAVIHCAAYISVVESISNPVKYFNNNVGGTASIAKACGDTNIGRIVYLSSAAVYGEPKKVPLDENHPVEPVSPYGLTKLMGEQVVKHYAQSYGFNYVNLRLFNVYGPRQVENEYSSVINRFIRRVREGNPPIIYGDGEQTRDFIHVRDTCTAVEKSLLTRNVNQAYNIGSGKPIRIMDLAEFIIQLSGLRSKPLHEAPQEGEIKHSRADVSKARELLGFEPRISIEEGVRELFQEGNSK